MISSINEKFNNCELIIPERYAWQASKLAMEQTQIEIMPVNIISSNVYIPLYQTIRIKHHTMKQWDKPKNR